MMILLICLKLFSMKTILLDSISNLVPFVTSLDLALRGLLPILKFDIEAYLRAYLSCEFHNGENMSTVNPPFIPRRLIFHFEI